jgi:cytoskeletal protein RodZ
MSLINDALKRAREVQQQAQPPPPAQFKPVEPAQTHSRPSFLVFVLIVILLVGGGVFIGMALNRSGATKPIEARTQHDAPAPQRTLSSESPSVPAAPAVAQSVASKNASTAQPAGSVENETSSRSMDANLTSTNVVEQVAAVTTPPKPAVPIVRGIFYNPDRPSAVLNSKTVYVGDSVAGFRVIDISHNSVTVTSAGETNVLTLPE